MASTDIHHGSRSKTYANGYDLNLWVQNFDNEAANDSIEVTTLSSNGVREHKDGLKSRSLSWSGVVLVDDSGFDTIDQMEQLDNGEVVTANQVIGEEVTGAIATLAKGVNTGFGIGTTFDDAASAELNLQGSGNTGLGRVLSPRSLKLVDGSGTALDNAAGTTAGMIAQLQLIGLEGTSKTVTVIIEHSTNGTTWSTLATFGAQTNAHIAKQIETSGTVHRYTRASWDMGATTTAADFQVTLARKVNS